MKMNLSWEFLHWFGASLGLSVGLPITAIYSAVLMLIKLMISEGKNAMNKIVTSKYKLLGVLTATLWRPRNPSRSTSHC